MNQFAPEDEVVLHIAITGDHIPETSPSNDFEAIADTILETASILPNTHTVTNDDGNVVCNVSMADDRRYGHIVDRLWRLAISYERLCRQRNPAH